MKHTSSHIIQAVAPVLNKKGYVGTSLSDITHATGLTKGAIYGNFKDKEDLAVQVFKFSIRKITSNLAKAIDKNERSIDKLYAITNYYRSYFDITEPIGGCPIINGGIDTNHVNPTLFKLVRTSSAKLQKSIEDIIQKGILENQFKKHTNAEKMARNIYSMMEGSILLSTIHEDRTYIINMMDYIDELIKKELVN